MSFELNSEVLKQMQSVQKALQSIDVSIISKRLEEFNNYKNPAFEMPKLTNSNLASEFHERLIKIINDFDEKLNQNEEVGVRLVNFGQAVTFSVENIGYWNPSLIRFYGQLEDGTPVELIQHVTQISFLLMALKRKNPDEPKRKIGFCSEAKSEETQE
ncbi:DUF6173 family protein [Desulfosporosinus sp. PR]|uniref:DUF6173 family protein n=1 Tax=Candidatus Desulfosporosinus nitrosoreducens TaxID=3401928 RepID=UPI0027F87B34|nr:DUF6173 family protein [Desulfosporosinus sp. PR]MDQ7096853.1 DUF6173 family protein [Desulfosporosinus sp. PR]